MHFVVSDSTDMATRAAATAAAAAAAAEVLSSHELMLEIMSSLDCASLLRACSARKLWAGFAEQGAWEALVARLMRRWTGSAPVWDEESLSMKEVSCNVAKYDLARARRAARHSPAWSCSWGVTQWSMHENDLLERRLSRDWKSICAGEVTCECVVCNESRTYASHHHRVHGRRISLVQTEDIWHTCIRDAGQLGNFVCVAPSKAVPARIWDGLLLGPPGTPYFGGLFEFVLIFSEPMVAPTIFILTPIMHPAVSPTGKVVPGAPWAAFLRDGGAVGGYTPAIGASDFLVVLFNLLCWNKPPSAVGSFAGFFDSARYSPSQCQAFELQAKRLTRVHAGPFSDRRYVRFGGALDSLASNGRQLVDRLAGDRL